MTTTIISDFTLSLVATSAAAVVVGLVALQTDRISMKILDPKRLCTKRRQEYTYRWRNAIDKVKLQLDYAFAGGQEKFNEDPEVVLKCTEYFSSDTDLDSLISRILDKTIESRFYILKIDKDPHDPTGEYYLFLVEEQSVSKVVKLYEVPLISFGMKLATAFEDQLTSTTLCFVADASSGSSTCMLECLVTEAKTGVAVISEPFWMVQVALLAEASIFPSTKIQRLLLGLCRLEAWSVRAQVGVAKTVMFTLPGQSTTAALLPLIQQTFPDDRHVFGYDGCLASVQRGVYAHRTFRQSRHSNVESIIHKMGQDPVRVTTPLPSNSPLTMDAAVRSLEEALTRVPIQHAQSIETWMSSVDAYFKLKNDTNGPNGYLPFVFKLSFLTNPAGNFEPGTDSYWCLNSLLQYVTGTSSKGLSTETFDAAKEWLKDYNQEQIKLKKSVDALIFISEEERKNIENCVFQHKSILIGNKTLQDTVMPREHWTLKQSSRAGGCACCGPDPYDELEEEGEGEESKSDRELPLSMDTPGAFAVAFKDQVKTNSKGTSSNEYVDGKLGFAFDPTRFS
jgi:hypothetical protein